MKAVHQVPGIITVFKMCVFALWLTKVTPSVYKRLQVCTSKTSSDLNFVVRKLRINKTKSERMGRQTDGRTDRKTTGTRWQTDNQISTSRCKQPGRQPWDRIKTNGTFCVSEEWLFMLLWVMTRCLLNPVETGSDLVCSGTAGAPERCKCTLLYILFSGLEVMTVKQKWNIYSMR